MLYTGFKKFLFFFAVTFFVVFLYKPHSGWGFGTTLAQDLGWTLGVIVNPLMWLVFCAIDTVYKKI